MFALRPARALQRRHSDSLAAHTARWPTGASCPDVGRAIEALAGAADLFFGWLTKQGPRVPPTPLAHRRR